MGESAMARGAEGGAGACLPMAKSMERELSEG